MTDPQQDHPIIHSQEVVPIQATANERLAQLHAAYADSKARRDEADAQFKAISDAIKSELTTLAPEGSTRIGLTGDHGPALGLTYAESWRIDSRRLKREDPETYVRYAVQSGSWTLRADKPGGDQ